MGHPMRFRGARTVLLCLLVASSALADSIDDLIKELKTNDDFRVRTQAALSLGKTKDARAVDPLCGALDDGNDAVRGAAASALGKLGKKDGKPCLEARREKESSDKVKSAIDKALRAIEGVPAGTKVYVSVGKVNNKTGRDDVTKLVRSTLKSKVEAASGYAVAPSDESSDQAKKVIADKGLKGFALLATAEAPVYKDDKLTVAVRMVVTGYPGSDVKAEFAPKFSQTGVSEKDKSAEDELMKMALEKAVDDFQKFVGAL